MRLQITVRIPGELVAYLDEQVAEGAASSRADVVARALARERRRSVALADARILQARADVADDDGWDELAQHAARQPLDLD